MPAGLDQLAGTTLPVPLADALALPGFLDLVPDPRSLRGRRYWLSPLVAAAAPGLLSGACSLTAITELISDIPAWACRALGFPTDPLSGIVSTTSPMSRPNHPGVLARVRHLPWQEITLDRYDRPPGPPPPGDPAAEDRRLRPPQLPRRPPGPSNRVLEEGDFAPGKLTIERVHLITSLPPGAAAGAQIADWIRGHWKIENLLHHIRDRTFREDDSKIQVGHLPRIMAGLRNLAIGVHRQDGHTNIAAALRHTARDWRRPLAALGITG